MKLQVQENNTVIVELLQIAVNAETASRNLYWARSIFWRNAGLPKLADYYLQQSQEDHAQRSADRMAFLGSLPVLAPTQVQLVEDDSIKTQYERDLEVEIALAEHYQESIERAEALQDFVTSNIWRKVLKSTQEHIDYLQGEITKIELMTEPIYLSTWA